MTTVAGVPEVAAVALVQALTSLYGFRSWDDRPALQVHGLSEKTTRALLDLLTDVTVVEWEGPESGTGYRTYRGVLPCRLPLEVITERDEVPNLLDTAPQADLDGPADEARAGERR
jgi:hypothetical protein